MTRLRTRRQFIRPWYIPIPGDPGGDDEMAFFFDGVTYTPGELTAGSGARTLDIELTLGGNAITSGTGAFVMFSLSDTDFDGDTYLAENAKINSITGGAITNINVSDYRMVDWIFIPAAAGHVKCTLTYANASVNPESCYPCVILPSGAVDISAEFIVPATTG